MGIAAAMCGGLEEKNVGRGACALLRGRVRSRALHQLLSSHAALTAFAAFCSAPSSPHAIAYSLTYPIILIFLAILFPRRR